MARAALTLLALTFLSGADLKVGPYDHHREVGEFREKNRSILPDLPDLPVDPPELAWREARQYLGLFTPPRAPDGLYRTFVSTLELDAVLDTLRTDPSLIAAPGSFVPQSVHPSEAFGQSGGYNRWKLALLFGARRTRVARGPRLDDGEVVEAWTLISPYPDPSLSRLEPGTLRIVLNLRHRD